ncbi:MAG TPA: 16S rRNA (guanine(966)-N(2))-methyltransferase RsmD [Candidatus Limnocylindrales bacterium]|nr:16S rRNA (guanine(966)-N(2))-methyltransferase RsmD [Candidatus Limnocylindrales bacterium]
MADAGRVVAGSARGVRLVAPGEGTRPLADRVKETLFAILEPELREARFLDLFAGSGAAGIEALSRGAAAAVFVEKDAGAARTIEENLRRAHLDRGRVVRADVVRWLRGDAAAEPFDVAFADPPYADPQLLLRALEALGAPERAIVATGARVVAKHFWRERPPATIGLLASDRERRFGETALTFYRRLANTGEPQPDEEAR